jgi:hypothetical protein
MPGLLALRDARGLAMSRPRVLPQRASSARHPGVHRLLDRHDEPTRIVEESFETGQLVKVANQAISLPDNDALDATGTKISQHLLVGGSTHTRPICRHIDIPVRGLKHLPMSPLREPPPRILLKPV